MATTYTSNARLQKPAASDRSWDQPLNANADLLDGLAPVGWLVVTPTEYPSTSLNVRVAAGSFRKSDGTYATFAGSGSVALPASTTTYFWLDESLNLNQGTAWPSTPAVRLALVATGPVSITSILDWRVPFTSAGAASFAPTGSQYVTLATDSTLTNERVLTPVANQTTLTDGGAGQPVKLGTAQSIGTTSTPTFAQVTVSNAPANPTDTATKGYVDAGDATNATAASNANTNATNAQTSANNAQSSANAANTNANTRVLRSGDTMTGPLAMAGQVTPTTVVTAAYTVVPTDMVILANATNGVFTITLPAANATGFKGMQLRIKQTDVTSNNVVVTSTSPIDGNTTITLGTKVARTLVSEPVGNTWNIC